MAAAERAAADQALRDDRDLATARSVLSVHAVHNRRYIAELLARINASDDPDERGWLAVAVLRALYDLDRMRGRS